MSKLKYFSHPLSQHLGGCCSGWVNPYWCLWREFSAPCFLKQEIQMISPISLFSHYFLDMSPWSKLDFKITSTIPSSWVKIWGSIKNLLWVEKEEKELKSVLTMAIYAWERLQTLPWPNIVCKKQEKHPIISFRKKFI